MRLLYGIISEVDYDTSRARVHFDENDIVSDWLTLPKSTVKENRHYAVNMQVAVIMHENGEDGEILHEVPYEGHGAPAWASKDVEGFEFKDGTKVTYDNSTKTLKVDGGVNEMVFDCAKLTVKGSIEATGDIKATGDVKSAAGTVSLTNHLHTTPAGPSGTPIPSL